MSDHTDFLRVDEIEGLQVIDCALVVPHVFSYSRPVGKLLVEVRRVVRLAARLDTLAVTQVIRSECYKARLHHRNGEIAIANWWCAWRWTRKTDRRFLPRSTRRAVKADDGWPLASDSFWHQQVRRPPIAQLHCAG